MESDWHKPVCDVGVRPGQCCSPKSWAAGRCDGGIHQGRFCQAGSPGPAPAGGNQHHDTLLHQESSWLRQPDHRGTSNQWRYNTMTLTGDPNNRRKQCEAVGSNSNNNSDFNSTHDSVSPSKVWYWTVYECCGKRSMSERVTHSVFLSSYRPDGMPGR